MSRRDLLHATALLTLGNSAASVTRPDRSGFRVPAEEDRHQGTFMQWPVSRRVYGESGWLSAVQRCIAMLANRIAEFEPVIMLADAADHAAARRRLGENVELWDVPTEDLWCRDSGPLFARNGDGDLAVLDLRFNGWGKRQRHVRDARIAARVAQRLGMPLLPTGLVGEAGGVEQDGAGLLIAHRSSWVNNNRNPGLSQAQIGERLLAAYGAQRILWSEGVYGEDITDYHIDSLARLTGPGRVLINLPAESDPADPFHRAAAATHEVLKAAGLAVECIAEPQRRRVSDTDFVASYANYYVCNGALLVAQFGDRNADRAAQHALCRHFPGREIIALNVDELGLLGGGIHCATREMPAISE